MQHSSRINPCPICYRDRDDKCRWSEEAILCYLGDKFHPPLHLLIGDAIIADGCEWKLARMDAGFSSNSYLFVKKTNFKELTPLERRKQREILRNKSIDWKSDFNTLRSLVYKSFSTPEFESLTYQEFVYYKKITHQAIDKCEEILSSVTINKNYIKLKKFTIQALLYWRKSLRYQLKDFVYFEFSKLGIYTENPEHPDPVPLRKPGPPRKKASDL